METPFPPAVMVEDDSAGPCAGRDAQAFALLVATGCVQGLGRPRQRSVLPPAVVVGVIR